MAAAHLISQDPTQEAGIVRLSGARFLSEYLRCLQYRCRYFK